MSSVRLCVGAALVLATVPTGGCAQIVSSSTVEIVPRPDARPLVLGGPGGEITQRGVSVQWTQQGDRIALRLDESRACESVRHVPVMRVERVERKTVAGAMWWEYGVGTVALAGGLVALIRPEAFSQATISADGTAVRETATGYRIGGIFTAIGAVLLTAAVIDTVRTRDQVLYTDAYRRERGDAVACRQPVVPLAGQTVELLIGGWSSLEPTDEDGAVRFLLPEESELPDEARAVVQAYAQWDAAKAEADVAAGAAAKLRAEAEALAEAEAAKRKGRRGKKDVAASEAALAEAEAAEGAVPQVGPPPEPVIVRGVLRVDSARALAVDFVVPYGIEAASGHAGEVEVEPGPVVNPPPRPTKKKGREGDGEGREAEAVEAAGGAATVSAE